MSRKAVHHRCQCVSIKPGHHDHVPGLDHRDVGRIEVAANRNNCAVPDMHLAIRQVADVWIDGEHVAAANNELAPGRERAAAPAHKWRSTLCLCRVRLGSTNGRSKGSRKLEYAAPMKRAVAKHVHVLLGLSFLQTLWS